MLYPSRSNMASSLPWERHHTTQSSITSSPLSFGLRSCCTKKKLFACTGAQHHKKVSCLMRGVFNGWVYNLF
ncbi:hypothetical protein VTH06DRAFT_1716 [Thermothelomyces fergusii]